MYEFVCLGSSSNYVWKTERTLFERNVEHLVITKIELLTPLFSDNIVADLQNLRTSPINLVQISTRIIDSHNNRNILLFKEAIKIKEKKPILNTGLKAF